MSRFLPILLFLTASALSALEITNAEFGGVSARGERSDSFLSNLLTARMRQTAAAAVPRKTPGMPPERDCVIRVATRDEEGFETNSFRGGVRITLPRKFGDWAFSSGKLREAASEILKARLGSSAPVADEWLVTAMIRDAFDAEEFFGSGEYGRLPAAYAMVSAGAVPDPAVLLNAPSGISSGVSGAADSDWCALFLMLCSRSGAARSGALERYLLARRDGKKPADALFREYLFLKLSERFLLLRRDRIAPSLGEWFSAEAARALLSRFDPDSPQDLETRYRNLTEPAEGPGLSELARKTTAFTLEEQLFLSRVILGSAELAAISPDGVALCFQRVGAAARLLRDGSGGALPAEQLEEAEKSLFTELEVRGALLRRLRTSERRLIPASARFALTFAAMEMEKISTPTLLRAEELLDRHEER